MTRSDVASENFQFCEIYTAQDASAVIEGDAGTDETDCLTEAIPKNLSDINTEHKSFAPSSIRLELSVHDYQTHVIYFHFHAALLVHVVALN